jgi:hypothetical protein
MSSQNTKYRKKRGFVVAEREEQRETEKKGVSLMGACVVESVDQRPGGREGGRKPDYKDQKTIRILYYSMKKFVFVFLRMEGGRHTSLMGGTRKKHT